MECAMFMSLSPVRQVAVVVPVSRRVRLAVDAQRVCDTLEAGRLSSYSEDLVIPS